MQKYSKKQKEERARLVAAVEAAKDGRKRAQEALKAAEVALKEEWAAVRDAGTALEEFDARRAIERMPEDLREAIRSGEPIAPKHWASLVRRALARRNQSSVTRTDFIGLGGTVARLLREEGPATLPPTSCSRGGASPSGVKESV